MFGALAEHGPPRPPDGALAPSGVVAGTSAPKLQRRIVASYCRHTCIAVKVMDQMGAGQLGEQSRRVTRRPIPRQRPSDRRHAGLRERRNSSANSDVGGSASQLHVEPPVANYYFRTRRLGCQQRVDLGQVGGEQGAVNDEANTIRSTASVIR